MNCMLSLALSAVPFCASVMIVVIFVLVSPLGSFMKFLKKIFFNKKMLLKLSYFAKFRDETKQHQH